jgi:phosphinothricin acetyltransferase
MMTFRLAEEKDLENILSTYNASIPGRMATADLEPQSMEERKKWFEKHKEGNRPVWVIEKNSVYVGWMSFSNFYGRPAYASTAEYSIYVNPNKQRQGIGEAAIHYAMQQAPALGIKAILAYVFGHNVPSLNLFKKAGFETWGHFPGVAELNGMQRDLIILGRRI